MMRLLKKAKEFKNKAMKCKDCNAVVCFYRNSDAEKECRFQESVICLPDEWQNVRIRASIAAMQGLLCAPSYKADNSKLNMIAKDAVSIADALIEELKK